MMFRNFIIWSAIAAGFGCVAAPAGATQIIVGASGWNQDIILATSDTAPSGYTTNVSAWDYYESGFTGGGFGLPTDAGAARTFTSAANASVQFQFQPYTASNVVLLQNTGTTTATLTLTAPASFSTLQFLNAMQGASGGTWTATAHFTDTSSTLLGTFTDTDWTGTPTVTAALKNMGLRNINGSFYTGGLSMPEHDVTLAPADQLKTLSSIVFANTSTSSSNLMVFGISGNTVAPEPASLGLLAAGTIGLLARRRIVPA